MIIPALLVRAQQEFEKNVAALPSFVSLVQLDVMDNTFVPHTSWADARVITAMNLPFSFELHLMVNDPIAYLKQWGGLRILQRAVAHVEALEQPREFIESCRALGIECGLALSPGTPLDRITPYIAQLDVLLVLGVQPGESGQEFIPSALHTIRTIASYPEHPLIEVDGGVNAATLPAIREAGAQLFVSSSGIFNAGKPPKEALRELEALERG